MVEMDLYVNIIPRMGNDIAKNVRNSMRGIGETAVGTVSKAGGKTAELGKQLLKAPLKILPESFQPLAMSLAPLAAMGLLVKSSNMLQNVLRGILGAIMRLIRPIGDILAVALMPLLGILRPIGMFFNMIMKPYIRQAMDAMRTGNKLMKAEDFVGAGVAYTLGAAYMLKPFTDLMITGFTVAVQGILVVVKNLGSFILKLIPFVGEDWARSWEATFDGAIKSVGDFGEGIKTGITYMLDSQLAILKAQAQKYDTEVKPVLDTGFSSMYGSINNGFGSCVQLTKQYMNDLANYNPFGGGGAAGGNTWKAQSPWQRYQYFYRGKNYFYDYNQNRWEDSAGTYIGDMSIGLPTPPTRVF